MNNICQTDDDDNSDTDDTDDINDDQQVLGLGGDDRAKIKRQKIAELFML